MSHTGFTDMLGKLKKSRLAACAVVTSLTVACSHVAPLPEAPVSSMAVQSVDWASTWHHHHFPSKKSTDYSLSNIDGRVAMNARSNGSASLLRQKVHIEPDQLDRLSFSWKVPELIASADLATRDFADSPVRIVLAFEGDRGKFSLKNTLLSDLAHTLTGEPMPYATLMYVWCNTRAPGTVITGPRTDRIRKIVVESGAAHLNQWLAYERNVRADFEKAFGEPPGALVGIGIMTDSDNTRSSTQAWYGPVKLANRP